MIALALFGLSARHPSVQGNVATMYDIMRMSCQWWSSVDVIYVHPPHDKVLKMPIKATNLGSVAFGRAVRRYHKPTRTNRGPAQLAELPELRTPHHIPDVIAMKSMKKDLSG